MADGPTKAAWKHIGLHGHSVGSFTVEPAGIQWKSAIGTEEDISTLRNIPAKSITGVQWTVFGRQGYLRIQTDGGTKNNPLSQEYRFDGFPPSDVEKLRTQIQNLYGKEINKLNISAAGASFGNSSISRRNLVFRRCILEEANEEGEEFEPRDGDEMLSLDLADVSQCVLPGNNRNEIELQFHENDTAEAGTDQLVAVRFYIPPDPDTDPSDRALPTSAEIFHQRIMKKANIKNTAGDMICEFGEDKGTFLTPRGRYTIELYDRFLRMRGNKYDYKIKYDDINRLFLLPKPDDVHMAFVIALDKPIRQGQQRYQHLVMQTNKEPAEVSINLDEETLEKEYNGELQPIMNGALSNLVAKTFKVIAQKKVFIPGKFANANQQACVKCALRANEGHLYPLEKQFLFIHKPPVLIRFDEVESVEFQRYAGGQGSTRNFDLCVTLKQTSEEGLNLKEYIFSGIDRSDYAGLYSFLSGKKIRIKNLQNVGMEDRGPRTPIYNEDEIYGRAPGEEDEESSDDESYDQDAANEDEESESSSEDDDEDLGSGDDSDIEEARRKAAKEKKTTAAQAVPKNKKRPAPDEDEDGEDEEDEPETKKVKKKKAKKDPNAPKKALSAYMIFSNSRRASIKAANPDAKFGEIAKMVGEEWKKLDSDARKEFEDKATEDKERYNEEMEDYSAPEQSDNGGEEEANVKKKNKKDPNAPKRNMSAFFHFSSAKRAEIKDQNPDANFGDLARLVSTEFKNLSEEEKAKYTKLAEEDKERYEEEMKTYVPPKGTSPAPAKKGKGKKPKKDPNAPKRATTSFMFYSNAIRPKIKEKYPDLGFVDVAKKIGEKFNKLSPEDKKKWDDMAKKDKQRYKEEMEAYAKKQAQDDDENASSSDEDSGDDEDSD